jgi:membrane-associated phospholipid phosphatase
MKPEQKHKERANRFRFALSLFVILTGSVVVAKAQVCYPLSSLDRYIHKNVEKYRLPHTKIDDYVQYAPVIAAYGLGFVGVPARYGWVDRTFLTGASLIMESAVVHTLKHFVDVWRPDGSKDNSFPSGHTALAFVGAHLLHKEYKDVSVWISVAGYTAATATGAMRIMNRRHWLSDVVAGAGIGILSVEADYLLLPVFHEVTGLPENLNVAPEVGNNAYGITVAYSF